MRVSLAYSSLRLGSSASGFVSYSPYTWPTKRRATQRQRTEGPKEEGAGAEEGEEEEEEEADVEEEEREQEPSRILYRALSRSLCLYQE